MCSCTYFPATIRDCVRLTCRREENPVGSRVRRVESGFDFVVQQQLRLAIPDPIQVLALGSLLETELVIKLLANIREEASETLVSAKNIDSRGVWECVEGECNNNASTSKLVIQVLSTRNPGASGHIDC
nr:uncharacterized protein LOC117280267 [Nicotiana tomentosiformis]